MSKTLLNVSIRRGAKRLLIARAKATGRTPGELTEFAIINMPFIPAKDLKINLIRGSDKVE